MLCLFLTGKQILLEMVQSVAASLFLATVKAFKIILAIQGAFVHIVAGGQHAGVEITPVAKAATAPVDARP